MTVCACQAAGLSLPFRGQAKLDNAYIRNNAGSGTEWPTLGLDYAETGLMTAGWSPFMPAPASWRGNPIPDRSQPTLHDHGTLTTAGNLVFQGTG